MARGGVTLRYSWRGLDKARASMASAGEALANAYLEDADFALDSSAEGLIFDGTLIAGVKMEWEGDLLLCEIKPNAAMILFAASVMNILPVRARLRWADGWPHFHCSPNDERDREEGPAPRVPGELVDA